MAKKTAETYSAKESEQRFKAALLGSRLVKNKAPAKKKTKKKKASS